MPTINVELPDELYSALKKMQADSETLTWAAFFKKIVSNEVEVYLEFLSVDGERPNDHTIEFKLGEYVYHYENGETKLLSSPKTKQIRLSLSRIAF